MLKHHAQFLLDKEKDKPDARLRYRIKWEGNVVAFNIGYRIEIDKWSIDTQRCKANTTHGKKKVPANVINRKIQQFEQACEETFKIFELYLNIIFAKCLIFSVYYILLIPIETKVIFSPTPQKIIIYVS